MLSNGSDLKKLFIDVVGKEIKYYDTLRQNPTYKLETKIIIFLPAQINQINTRHYPVPSDFSTRYSKRYRKQSNNSALRSISYFYIDGIHAFLCWLTFKLYFRALH